MANSVSQEHLESLFQDAESRVFQSWNKEVIITYRLPQRANFVVNGSAACVDPANFDYQIGCNWARKDAISKMWLPEGYLLQLKNAGLIQTDII
jgi:hypothetical protein